MIILNKCCQICILLSRYRVVCARDVGAMMTRLTWDKKRELRRSIAPFQQQN